MTLQAPCEPHSNACGSSFFSARAVVVALFGLFLCACSVEQDLGRSVCPGGCADASQSVDASQSADAEASDLGIAGPCSHAFDCAAGSICLLVDDRHQCTPYCDRTDQCADGTMCLDVDLPQRACLTQDEQGFDPTVGIPCESDAECQSIKAYYVCARFPHPAGNYCTLPCDEEADCDFPLGGNWIICDVDPSHPERMACLPDPACFRNPLSCIDR